MCVSLCVREDNLIYAESFANGGGPRCQVVWKFTFSSSFLLTYQKFGIRVFVGTSNIFSESI